MKITGHRSNSGINTLEVILLSGFIAIFAMAALPRLGDSRLFSDIARAKRGMASIALAMEAYRLDNNGYPLARRMSPIPPPLAGTALDQRLLTTPISYMDRCPADAFSNAGSSSLPGYRLYGVAYAMSSVPPYYRRSYSLYPKTSWMTWSIGPDRLTNTGGYFPLPAIIENESQTTPAIGVNKADFYIGATGYYGMRYDPTNGEISYGDIYHFNSEALIRLN